MEIVNIIASLEDDFECTNFPQSDEFPKLPSPVDLNPPENYSLPYLDFLSEPRFSAPGVLDESMWEKYLINNLNNDGKDCVELWKQDDAPIVECMGQSCNSYYDLSLAPDIPREDYIYNLDDININKFDDDLRDGVNNKQIAITDGFTSTTDENQIISTDYITTQNIAENENPKDPLPSDTNNSSAIILKNNTNIETCYHTPIQTITSIIPIDEASLKTIVTENNTNIEIKKKVLQEEISDNNNKAMQIIPYQLNMLTIESKTKSNSNVINMHPTNTSYKVISDNITQAIKPNIEMEQQTVTMKTIKHKPIQIDDLNSLTKFRTILPSTNNKNHAPKSPLKLKQQIGQDMLKQINSLPYQVIKAGVGPRYIGRSRDPVLVRAAEYYSKLQDDENKQLHTSTSTSNIIKKQTSNQNLNINVFKNGNCYYLTPPSTQYPIKVTQSSDNPNTIHTIMNINKTVSQPSSTHQVAKEEILVQKVKKKLFNGKEILCDNSVERPSLCIPTQSITAAPTINAAIPKQQIIPTVSTPVTYSNNRPECQISSGVNCNVSQISSNNLPQVLRVRSHIAPNLNNVLYVANNPSKETNISTSSHKPEINIVKDYFKLPALLASPVSSTGGGHQLTDPCFITKDGFEVYQNIPTPAIYNKPREEIVVRRKRGRPRKNTLNKRALLIKDPVVKPVNKVENPLKRTAENMFCKILPKIPLTAIQNEIATTSPMISKPIVNNSTKRRQRITSGMVVMKGDVPSLATRHTTSDADITSYLRRVDTKYRKVQLVQTAEQRDIVRRWHENNPRKRHRGTNVNQKENVQTMKISSCVPLSTFNGIQAAMCSTVPPRIPLENLNRNNI